MTVTELAAAIRQHGNQVDHLELFEVAEDPQAVLVLALDHVGNALVARTLDHNGPVTEATIANYQRRLLELVGWAG